jgi:hypothetical protein
MVIGVRRGELCGLRWRNVDLATGVVALNRGIGQRNAETWEKDTKTHQHRRIALDPETVEILAEHQRRCVDRAASVGLSLVSDAFVFSLAPDGSTYLRPNSVSERYSDLVEKLGIETSLHKLRHYTATELITAGVDIRTVAGRLGHGGGGTTTLRVYAAWVSESDQRAATNISTRMPGRRPVSVTLPDLDGDEGQPALRQDCGRIPLGDRGRADRPRSAPAAREGRRECLRRVREHRTSRDLRARKGGLRPDPAGPRDPGRVASWDRARAGSSIAWSTCGRGTGWSATTVLEHRSFNRDADAAEPGGPEARPHVLPTHDGGRPDQPDRTSPAPCRCAVRRAGHREDDIGDYEMDLRDGTGRLLGTFVSASAT